MRVQDGILRLQDGSRRAKIHFGTPFLVYDERGGMGYGGLRTADGGLFWGTQKRSTKDLNPCSKLTARGRRIYGLRRHAADL